MSRVETSHRALRFGRFGLVAAVVWPLVLDGAALAGTRQFLVVLARSPKEVQRSGPRIHPLPQDIQDEYFDLANPQLTSFAEYWEEISYGDVLITGRTSDWIDLPWLIKVPGPDARRITLGGSAYGAGEGAITSAASAGVSVGVFGLTPPYARGGRDSVPGRPEISVWMPGERFADMNGDGAWNGLDEANNSLDFSDNKTGALVPDGLPDLRGPWVDLNFNGVPENPDGCVFFPDSDNDGNPDCCPDGPGTVSCKKFNPAAPDIKVCPAVPGDCNGNRIPDVCDLSCVSQACADTGWLIFNPGKCGGSKDELPYVPEGRNCVRGEGDGVPDECQYSKLDPCGAEPKDPNSQDPCVSRYDQCPLLDPTRDPSVSTGLPERCEYDDSNLNGELDIVEPFENFLRRWNVSTASWDMVSEQYVRDNYPGHADKLLTRASERTVFGAHDPNQFGSPSSCKCADGSPCVTDTITVEGREVSLTGVCAAGRHAQYEPPDAWSEAGSAKMFNPRGFAARSAEPEWYKQAWVDRYGSAAPPWGTGLTPAMERFTAVCVGSNNAGDPCEVDTDCPSGTCRQERRCFQANRGAVSGFGTGWVGCDAVRDPVISFTGGGCAGGFSFENFPCNAPILPEEANGIGGPLILFDTYVEHDDLASSKYHRTGDRRLGEVTSPFSGDIWGQDRGRHIPDVTTPPDGFIEAGGPYATHVHGNFGRDAGNVLYLEFLTWRTSPPYNSGRAWEYDTSLSGGATYHPFASPTGANLGFRDYNLDGMVDQGSVAVGERDTYMGGPSRIAPGANDNGTDSIYPWNRRRLVEDTMAILDDVIDFDDFVDTVALDRLKCRNVGPAATVPPALAGGAALLPALRPAGVLSGIVLFREPTCVDGTNDGNPCTGPGDCPAGECLGLACQGGTNAGQSCRAPGDCPLGVCVGPAAGDFPRSPGFFAIHNEDGLGDPAFLDDNIPASARDPGLEPGFTPRISWNLFAHDLVTCLGCGSRFDPRNVTDFQTAYAAHEYLHSWEGFPDLYDYDVFDNPNAENCPAGVWDIMARGGLVHPAPILKEKRCTEWVKPIDLASLLTPGVDTVLTLPPAEFVRDKSYYFLENDSRLGERYYFWSAGLGFDARMPGDGMLVMHTDVGSNPEALPQGQRSGDRPAFLIVQADGRNELQACRTGGDQGDAGDIWPGTSNKTELSFGTAPPAMWYAQNAWNGLDVFDVEPDGTGAVRLSLNWVPTSIPSLRFTSPPGGTSVGGKYQVRFLALDVFGGTTVKVFYVPDQKTCNGNGLTCDKTADCPASQFCRHDAALTSSKVKVIGTTKKTNSGVVDLSVDWNITGIPDGRYVLFAKLVPGTGADGTENKFTTPRPGRQNKGNGTLTVNSVAIDDDADDSDDLARFESWTVVAINAAGTQWRVISNLSQPVIKESDPNQDPWPKATTGQQYVSANGSLRFTINPGSKPFELGDSFTFSTTGITAPSAAVTIVGGVITDDPVAKIVAAPLSGDPPLTVSFDGRNSFQPNGEPLNFRWDFGDGTPAATGPTVSHVFTRAGTFTVVLRATNTTNLRFGEASVDIQVTNNSPKAVITAEPASGKAPLQVKFNASQSSDRETASDELVYQWDFGDGTGANDIGIPGSAIEVTHTYRNRADGTLCSSTSVCTFNVLLTVTDEGGKQATTTTKIIVGNTNPIASVTASPVQGSAPLEVRFSALGSSDADGDALKVDWVWGDGKTDLDVPLKGTDGTGIVKHTYTTQGVFHPKATVKDANGGTGAWPGVDITVTAPVAGSSDPSASFHICGTAPCNATDLTLPVLAEAFAVDASASFDRPTGGQIKSYSWDWGDGTPRGSGKQTTHTYTKAGTFLITLTVTDADTPAHTGRSSRIVEVKAEGGGVIPINQPPVPVFVVDPPSGVADETEFRFDASASKDPDGDSAKLTFTWAFGDGAGGSGKVVRHVYSEANPNGWVVRLTVRDEKNAERTATEVVVVQQTSGNQPPVARIGTGLRSGSAPLTLAFDGSNSFDLDGDPLDLRWEFRADGELIDVLTGPVVTRDFPDAGTFEVTLRVSDGRGGVAFAGPQPITVTPSVAPPPIDDGGGSGEPLPDGGGDIPDSAGQRPPAVCGMGMLMAMVGSLMGLTLMAASRRRRRS